MEQWKKQGVRNVCNVKKLTSIKPILLQHKNHDQKHESSKLVVSITAKMNDYLEDINTGKVVEGNKKYKPVTTIWIFILEDEQWKVSAIEESETLMNFVKTSKDMPAIESTVSRSAI